MSLLDWLKEKFQYEEIDSQDQHFYEYAEMIGYRAVTFEEHKEKQRKLAILQKLEKIKRSKK